METTLNNRTKIQLRDNRQVYRELEEPFMVITDLGVVMRYGEREEMEEYYKQSLEAYSKFGYLEMADTLILVEMPKDQEEVDRLFNISGYAKRYVPEAVSTLN